MPMGVVQCPICATAVPVMGHRCPVCGSPLVATDADRSNADVRDLLDTGTQLNTGSYSIGKVLGRGGFGITYYGADLRLRRPVALKEFFPAGAGRRGTTVVRPTTLAPDDYAAATR